MPARQEWTVRCARPADREALTALSRLAAAAIGRHYYTDRQLAAAIDRLAKIDPRLIAEESLYVAVLAEKIIGCGGWSRRGSLVADTVSAQLDAPAAVQTGGAAALRAFFVHPDYARQGIASALFRCCRKDARRQGFHKLEVLASAAAKQACLHFGFSAAEKKYLRFDDGVELLSYRMSMRI